VFASADGHVAASRVELAGLSVSSGLSPKGYIYTDRPAYRPGQTVRARGVVRDVVDGSYRPPADTAFVVQVLDARGRLLLEQARTLSPFGTFDAEFPLGEGAPVGQYTILARPADEEHVAWSGHFEVQQFQLQKMQLEIDFDRTVCFRGETIAVTVAAEYTWGEPVAGQAVRYVLPDGRSYVERTDAEGVIRFEYDTSAARPGEELAFAATAEGEDVMTGGSVLVAAFGFGVAVETSRPLALAEEPFDVRIVTTAPDGAPVGRDLTVRVMRREVPRPDAVLDAVPWIDGFTRPAAEVTVQEHEVRTDPATGRGTLRLALAAGGAYVLRASGQDRFGRTVAGESSITVSDDADATRLRLLAETDTLDVGRETTVRLHSRVESGLVLLTWEGETIIEHRVVPVRAGDNPVLVAVGHEHFPEFALTATMMDGRALRTATRRFAVRRELHVDVTPRPETLAPGESATVELRATDQNGDPVVAELSLAMVDEALFDLYPDATPDIVDFFQRDARREVEFRVAATNGFSYEAVTRETIEAVGQELARLAEAEEEAGAMEAVRGEVRRQASLPAPRGGAGMAGRGRAPAAAPQDRARELQVQFRAKSIELGSSVFGDPGLAAALPQPSAALRRDRAGAGWWQPAIVTGDDGRAAVTLTAPPRTTTWRLTARGVTVETLVGQATATMTTRKELFVDIKAPRSALEGDQLAVVGRVHSTGTYAGPVRLTLTATVDGGTIFERRRTVEIGAGASAETVFDAFTVPAATGLELALAMEAGDRRDAIGREIDVRPWGMPYAAHGGGIASGDASLQLRLPEGLPYQSRWLTVSVGPSLEQVVIDMALGRPSARRVIDAGAGDGSELLAAISALAYARTVDAAETDRRRLEERTRSLVAALVVAQREDGGWSWAPGTPSDPSLASVAYWALVEASRQGLTVSPDALRSAQRFLVNAIQAADAADREGKALILHALSIGGEADFKLANALYRDRNALAPRGLACTALALARLDRRPMAREVLEVLAARVRRDQADGRLLASWARDTSGWSWLDDEVSVTAMALLAFIELDPASPLVEPAVQFLLDRRGCGTFDQGRILRGAVVAALARHFAVGRFAGDDFSLAVSINGRPLRRIDRRGPTGPVTIEVPADRIADGANTIGFELRGRGQYAYAATLRGFSTRIEDPGSWQHPEVRWRKYMHAPLTYRGAVIGAESTSPVEDVEVGQRVHVRISITPAGSPGHLVIEEPVPAGMTVIPGSLRGHDDHYEVRDDRIVLYVPRGSYVRELGYELVGYASGRYRVLPTVIRDAADPSRFRIGQPAELRVLAPGESSDDPYRMNDAERFLLGSALFEDGRYVEALEHLRPLFERDRKYQERDVARMLLWIHTAPDHFDAGRVIEAFELLTIRHPELTIPFDRILAVGRAYRELGEFERAWAVFRATIDSSFLLDSNVSALLQDEEQLLGSIDYQESLWWEYPDTAEVESSYFALSQLLYEQAPNAGRLDGGGRRVRVPGHAEQRPRVRPTRAAMLGEAIRLLTSFRTLYPTSPLGDDAAFSLSNAYLDLRDYDAVVDLGDRFRRRYGESEFASSFQYMIALGHFWKRDYDQARDAAIVVAEGESRDRDFARYILGQIHHARGRPADALPWYELVRDEYPDAREAIEYFTRPDIELDEVSIFRPGEAVALTLRYRNVREAQVQVYKVDLMTLYLRERSLSEIARVNLAGIEPHLVVRRDLGDGRDYVDKELRLALELPEEGAYLVICRGDDLFTSGLALVTPLEIEVQEDPVSGRARVNVVDAVRQMRPAGVHVKAIGSEDAAFRSGDTDLRGVFVADGLRGTVTVIARDEESRYAFHRGETWLGPRSARPARGQQLGEQLEGVDFDYRDNLNSQNSIMQRSFNESWDRIRRSGRKGVQVDKAR
jgi:tetratricopeptide (TPR) repeat protein